VISKKIILPALGIAIAGGMILGTQRIYAQQKSNNSFSGLIQAIAQKFNLDQTAVKSVFEQYQQEKQANRKNQMQQRLSGILDQEVKDGRIKNDQKQAIINELNQIKTKYKDQITKDTTVEQRKQIMQKEQEELKSWASSQGIDLTLIPGYGRKDMHGGGRFKNWASPTPTP